MNESFGDVRIHTGPTAAAACESISARAFTVGNHIAFNSCEYDPESPEGQHVLAHELAHVRQQTGGAVSMLPQDDVELEVDPDPALEREAEETAQRVMSGGELGIQCLQQTQVHIQRTKDRVGKVADWSVERLKAVFGETDDGKLDFDGVDVVKEGLIWGAFANIALGPETAVTTGIAGATREVADQASEQQAERILDTLDDGTWIYRQYVRFLVNVGLERLLGSDEGDEETAKGDSTGDAKSRR